MAKSTTNSTQERIPFWIVVSSSVIATTGVGLWWLFRRPCKYLTTQDLPPTIAEDGVIVEPVRKLTESERNVIKTCFLASDDFQYVVAGKDGKTAIRKDAQLADQHCQATFQFIEYMLSFAERYGHVLVCRDTTREDSFLGAVALLPPYQSPTMFDLHFYRSILPHGMPVTLSMGKGPAARTQAFAIEPAVHKEIMKGIPHWYVQVMGVADEAQGRGVGRRLMEAAAALADGMPMYLDCHNGNVRFYEKLGFSVARKYDIEPQGIVDDPSTFQMNGMVRNMAVGVEKASTLDASRK